MPGLEQEIEAIEETMAADSDAYFRDERMQSRYSELLRAQEAGGPAPAGPSRNEARLHELEGLMTDGMSEYWRGPRADQLQSEYKALLEGKPPAAFEAVAEGAGAQPAGLVHSTLEDALGVSDEDIASTARRLATAFEGLDVRDMNQAFDGLSDFAKFGFYRVLFDPSILSSQERIDGFVREIGTEAFEEILAYERGLSPEEHRCLKRALFQE